MTTFCIRHSALLQKASALVHLNFIVAKTHTSGKSQKYTNGLQIIKLCIHHGAQGVGHWFQKLTDTLQFHILKRTCHKKTNKLTSSRNKTKHCKSRTSCLFYGNHIDSFCFLLQETGTGQLIITHQATIWHHIWTKHNAHRPGWPATWKTLKIWKSLGIWEAVRENSKGQEHA